MKENKARGSDRPRKYTHLNTKVTIIFIVLLLLTILYITYEFYSVNYNRCIDIYFEHATKSGEFISDIMGDGEKVDEWLEKAHKINALWEKENAEDPDLAEYNSNQRVIQELPDYLDFYIKLIGGKKRFTELFDLSSIYCIKYDRDENGKIINSGEVVFASSANPNEKEPDIGDKVTGIKTFESAAAVYDTNQASKSSLLCTDYDNQLLMTVFVPVKYSDGSICALIGVDVDMGVIIGVVGEETLKLTVVLFLMLAAFAVVFIIFIQFGIIKAVKTLSSHMTKFVSVENRLEFDPVTNIKNHDEIEQMADNYNTMAQAIIDYTKNLTHRTIVQEKLKFDLDVVGQVRRFASASAPNEKMEERDDIVLYSSEKNTVDNKCSFASCIMTGKDHMYAMVGESVGSSLASVLLSMLAATNIKCFARMGYSPYKIAAETNNQLCNLEKIEKGLTVCALIAEIDLHSGIMKYVNAGMPPVLMKKSGEDYEQEKSPIQFNLGEMRGVSFAEETVQLCQGYTVMFTSYGVSDMKNPAGERFTEKRVQSEINEISAGLYELPDIVSELERRLDKYRGDAPAELDTTILAFRYNG